MKRGQLKIKIPNGQQLLFGEDKDELSAQIDILNWEFFKKCLLYGDIGFGESYCEGDWQSPCLKSVISWFILNIEDSPVGSGSKKKKITLNLMNFKNRIFHLLRANSKSGSRKNISYHYDLSNDFFQKFLDSSMTYSSGFFNSADCTLEQAQRNKYQKMAENLELKRTDHLLEIGCGWGGFSIYCAQNYGCRVTAITISDQQFNFAQKKIEQLGLTAQIQLLKQDYRTLKGQFDKIASIEMMEALGDAYVPVFFEQCHRLLKKDGLLSFQVITCPDHRYDEFKKGVDWIQKYIFPGSLLLPVSYLLEQSKERAQLHLYRFQDMGIHYAETLRQWYENFNNNRASVRKLGFDLQFERMWEYYLKYCEAAFFMRNISVVQMTLTKANNLSLKTI